MAPAWSKGTDNVHSQQSSERASDPQQPVNNPATTQQQQQQQQRAAAAATANCNVFIWKCNLIKVQNVLIAFPFLPCKKQKNNSEKNRREREEGRETGRERETRVNRSKVMQQINANDVPTNFLSFRIISHDIVDGKLALSFIF